MLNCQRVMVIVMKPSYTIIIITRRTRSLPGHLDGDHVAWPTATSSTRWCTATHRTLMLWQKQTGLCAASGKRLTIWYQLISLATTALLKINDMTLQACRNVDWFQHWLPARIGAPGTKSSAYLKPTSVTMATCFWPIWKALNSWSQGLGYNQH